MESSRKESAVVKIPKRKRSLDQKRDSESQISKRGGNKRKVSSESDHLDAKKKKKRKTPKEVPLSSFLSDAKKSRKRNDGSGSKMELGSKDKSGASRKGLQGVSLPLGDSENSIHIPKRPRGSVGRKRLESDQGSESFRLSSSFDRVESHKEVTNLDNKAGSSLQSVRLDALPVGNDGILNSRLAGKSSGLNVKCKKADSKSSKNSGSNVRLNQKNRENGVKKKRDGHVLKQGNRALKNGDASRKRDRFEASIRETMPTAHSSVSNSLSTKALDDEDDEDDEENLQRNAARMLSSRFDPSCTSSSFKTKPSLYPMAKELIGNSISLNVESASGNENMRTLRPKRGDGSLGLLKKRRHFYEVQGREVDPYWVLKRRIKIFWPLDGSWYEGIVNDYHSKTKLHHIKYKDRDEEWLNLEEENFKLLLLRSEVPGKEKSQNRFNRDKDLHVGQIVPLEDDESSIGNSLDSEPIAMWLASQSQRVKALPKSSKRPRTAEGDLPLISSASERTDVWNDDVDGSETTKNEAVCACASADTSLSFGFGYKSLSGNISKSDKHLVYVRKKNQKKFAGSSSVLRDAEACSGAHGPDAICLSTSKLDSLNSGHVSSHKELCAFSANVKSSLCNTLRESKGFRFRICLPLLKSQEVSCGRIFFWLFHDIFWLQHGVIVTCSPSVFVEILLIDSNLGLRLLLFEGCLEQALVIIFESLSVFGQCDQQWDGDNKLLPVTSIRFQISSVHDQRKQYVLAAYCFSKLQRSIWLYLESEILQKCLPIKQLPLSECTNDKIKELECRILQPLQCRFGFKLLSTEDSKKKPDWYSEACNARKSQSPLSLATEPENDSQSSMSVLNLHLQSLMQQCIGHVSIQNQVTNCSQKSAEQKCEQPIIQFNQCKLSSVTVQDNLSDHEIRQSDADGFVLISSPTGSKSTFKRGKSSRISSPHGINSFVWSSGKPNFTPGPKKPRTQVQYTLPLEGYDMTRNQEKLSSRAVPYKRIRRASLRTPDISSNNEKKLDLRSCSVNVLVTNEDRGWRECGGYVFLEIANDNEWTLAVTLSGVMRFSYKVKHIMQPGSANRYSHAMMWKGGKNWVLEFPERGQWTLFKEMYEECYNRNIRAASVKNIPIPGVRLVDEYDDCGPPFVRNPAVYFRQVQSDAELAMDPSHVLYDMDSDDEQWLMEQKNCVDKHKCEQLSDNFLEMAMDMFEKVAYAQHCEYFTDAEVEELAAEVGSVEAAKLVYQHWKRKRDKMRMPLIRHFQPPPWERYQRQLKEWEQNVSHGICAASVGGGDREKPPMFAFCLKPRGLDVPNRGSKQRSHRKFTFTGSHLPFAGDRDSSLVYDVKYTFSGRIPNGHAFGGKMLFTNSIHEVSDIPLYSAARVWSPRNTNFLSTTVWKVNRKVSRNKHKRLISHLYSHGQQATSQNHIPVGDKNGVRPWDFKQLDVCTLDEFRLRDALGAAQHTCKIAKFKRDKAQSLLFKADIAIQKAVSSLMNAEAMKVSFENLKA